MKRILLSFLQIGLLSFVCQSLSAHDFYVGGIYYNYLSKTDKTVAVTFKGVSCYSYDNEYSGNVVIPESVSYNGTTYSVTSIGGSAFCVCTGLTSINIPNSVTSIGRCAFEDCKGLTSIVIASENSVYDSRNNCNAIIETATNTLIAGCKNTVIPNSVTSIGYYAFSGCTGLTSIVIPNSVTSIGSYVFYGCKGLTSIEIPSSVTSIGDCDFQNCTGLTSIEIPNSVTSIGEDAFYGCTGLTNIEIPNSVTNIGENAFYNTRWYNEQPNGLVYAGKVAYKYMGAMPNNTSIILKEGTLGIADCAFEYCTSLTSIEIPNSVTSIGWSAFSGCTSLTSIEIPNSVTNIGSYTFYGCTGLTSIVIPNSVTNIGSYTFYGCTGLTSIVIPSSVVAIDYNTFSGCNNLKKVYNYSSLTLTPGSSDYGHVAYYAEVVYNNCRLDGDYVITYVNDIPYICGYLGQDTELTLPAMYGIGDYAFYDCKNLINVSIPNGVTSIGKAAFSGCTGLASIEIPNSVTSIGEHTFYGCTGLTSIEIPNSVTSIGKSAFSDCTGLMNIEIPNSVKGIGKSAFSNCTNLISIEIPNSVTNIGSSAFSGCKGLTSIEIPNSVTSIGEHTFSGCKGLTSIVIPSSVTSIGNSAFNDCIGLTIIVIPSSVASIGSSAFYNCNNLKKVYNCSSLTLTKGSSDYGYVAYYATSVYNTCQLEEDYVITIVNDNQYVCGYLGQETELTLPATYGISENAFYGCKDLTKVSIPNDVTYIGECAFSGCTGMTSIEIPNSVTTIGKKAFEGCTGTISINCDIEDAENSNEGWYYGSKFSEVILGEAVNKVGKYAFYGLTSIKSLTIGGNVNRIGYYAFDNCTGLKSIYSNAVNPPACRDNAFHEDTKWDCPLYVPKESLEAYKAANVWKSFLDIKENPFYSSLESIATMDKNDAPLYDLQGTQVVAPRPNGLYIRDGKKIILK